MARKQRAAKVQKRVKTSLALSEGVHWRLTALAARLRRDRSEFANEIIDQGLSRYDLDKGLRRFAPSETGEDEAVA